MARKRPLAIGIEDYRRMIDKPYYYVDKTLMMKDLIDKGGAVNLFTRPRRFGKTLTLSMIKTFFECSTDIKGNVTDTSHYFDGMKIQKAGEEYMNHQGQYPVISLSLKSARQPDYEMAYGRMKEDISLEFKRHRYVLEGDILLEDEKEQYMALMTNKADEGVYATSLKFLSRCLSAYHGRNTIILLDEYDVPLENAHFRGFYERMVDFIRSLFESALKTNDSLEFAVITGCLRISKESIFTGLNNLKVVSILTVDYAEYFGFTEPEVIEMLEYYGIQQKMEEVKDWYDGYQFGNTEVYNPWSVLNYVESALADINAFPRSYWSNTSSNSIVRELIETADTEVKKQIENLIAGGSIEIPIHEDITYDDIHTSQDNLWNFLFFTGYLKKISERFEMRSVYLTLTIPNEEVTFLYENTILDWFGQKVKAANLSRLYQAFADQDCAVIEQEITDQLMETISFYDYAENYYHGFLTGLLKGYPGCEISSNRESGNGRPDIVIATRSVRGMAMILELKVVKEFDQMEAGCDAALAQIKEQKYEEEWYHIGYRNIKIYGICFYRKECMVKTQEQEIAGT